MAYCTRTKKTGFRTQLDCDIAIAAVQAKRARRRKQRFTEDPQRSYQCEFCRKWHMTSQNKGEGVNR